LAVGATEGLEHPAAATAVVEAHRQTAQTVLEPWVVLVVLVSPRQSLEPHTVVAAAAAVITPPRWRLAVLVVAAAEATAWQETSALLVAKILAGAGAAVVAIMLPATAAAALSLCNTTLGCECLSGLGSQRPLPQLAI
jgi:hypothetical protein